MAIQLAKLKGAYVVTTCGPASIDFCKVLPFFSLGDEGVSNSV